MKNRPLLFFLILLFLISLLFTRFFNLAYTTRFTRDESSNLVDMHRIYLDREITMLGPIDPALTIIYPSLSHYLHLPGAVLGNFEPYSPAYVTAAFSVATGLIFLLITWRVNKKLLIPIAIFVIVWFPLLESGRWAWNPHLVPFFSLIALYLSTKKQLKWNFLSGIFFGLSFHLHYVTVVSFAFYIFSLTLQGLYQKEYKKPIVMALGFFVMIIPFIYFDLKNPPGLFFGRFMHQNLVKENFWLKATRIATTVPQNFSQAFHYMNQFAVFSIISFLLFLDLALQDIKKYRENLLFLIPFLFQIVFISLLPSFQSRYVLLGIPFLLFWVIQKRDSKSHYLAIILIVSMILGSIITLPKALLTPTREPDSVSIKQITDFIQQETTEKNLKNTNIVVVASVDPDPLGAIYRHLLLVRHVPILNDGEYHLTDNLFVVTTADEQTARKDDANILNAFRSGPKRSEITLSSGWKVYLLNKY